MSVRDKSHCEFLFLELISSGMRDMLSIVLCAQLLLDSLFGGGVEEFGRVSDLADHYNEHKLRDPGIGLVDFVYMHYTDPAHGRSEPERHARLPFGTHHSLPQFVIGAFTNSVITIPPAPEPMAIAMDATLPTALLLRGIFHPPKLIV